MRNISALIIEAYRKSDRKTLVRFAENMELPAEELKKKPAAAFRKMMLFYHPDRRMLIHRKIREWEARGSTEPLERLARCIRSDFKPAPYAAPPPSREERFREEYSNPQWEDLWGDDYLHTESDATRVAESETFEFIEAVRSFMYGNLYSDFLPKDLYHLDGELDLSEEGIGDLSGIEYCINITELTLSRNRISNLRDLSPLTQLRSLDLSHNDISYIDELENLVSLVNLDLSFNSIEDCGPLENIPELRYVNFIGNPLKSLSSLRRLRAKGIIVISDLY